jgi:putative aldouronate transport system substrate-binding protein
MNDLWNAGVFHPNTYTSIDASRGDYSAGKFVIWNDQFGNGWQLFWRKGLQSNGYNFNIIPPFSARAGQKPQFYLTGGYLGATALKKASPDRIKELLGILNYLAAPFGSAEDLLLTSGVNGVDYTLDPKGNPVLTKQGNADANYTPWKYVTQHPAVIYTPDIPNYAKTLSNAEHTLIPYGVSDPTVGLISPTQITKGAALTQPVADGTVDIIVGRRPLSDWDGLVRDYFTGGGEQIRTEFMNAIQASH